jgi:hypothetical protein
MVQSQSLKKLNYNQKNKYNTNTYNNTHKHVTYYNNKHNGSSNLNASRPVVPVNRLTKNLTVRRKINHIVIKKMLISSLSTIKVFNLF